MSSAIVIYRSKTGFTQTYAQWIAEALGCQAVPYGQRNGVDLAAYDLVLYGGGFHAGRVRGLKWLKAALPTLAGKAVVVFATGASPADSPDVQTALRQNFTDAQWAAVRTFYLQSGLRYEKMGPSDRLMMAVFRKFLQKGNVAGNAEMAAAIASSYDCTSRDALAPLLAHCRALLGR